MSQPTPYTPNADFSQQEANNASGRSTVNTAALDAEFAAIETTLDQTLANIQLLQRDDGQLKDTIVSVMALDQSVINLMGGWTLKGAWLTVTNYAVNDIVSSGEYTYVCLTAHQSGIEFDSQYWSRFGFAGSADAAIAAGQASASAASAATSATTATTKAASATASATAAATSSGNAADYAATATTKAGEAAASAANAANSAAKLPNLTAAGANKVVISNDLGSAWEYKTYQDLVDEVDISARGAEQIGYLPAGTGAVSADVQSKLREIISINGFGPDPTGAADSAAAFTLAGSSAAVLQVLVTPGIYKLNSSPVPSGAVTWVIQAGATFTGAGILKGRVIYQGEQPDWLGSYQLAAGLGFKATDYCNDYTLTSDDTESLYTKISGARTLKSSMVRDYVGLTGYAINNSPTHATRSWAGYFEGARLNEVVGATYGIEVEVLNLGTTYPITPYTQDAKQSVGIQLGSGAELYDTPGESKDTSCALNIVGANSKFDKGIIFHADSIVGTDGVTGTGLAIAFAKGHAVQWFSDAGTGTNKIVSYSTTANNSASLLFQEGYSRIAVGGNVGLQINQNNSTVNGVLVTCGTTGNAAAITAEGADANINLVLAGKGTGSVAFGTHAPGALSPTGYISIKDSSGTVRRILVG